MLRSMAVAALAVVSAQAQPVRIPGVIDPHQLTTLKGSVSPLAKLQFDQGPAAPSFKFHYITLMLRQSPRQHAALLQLLADQQNPKSPQYGHWLTPEDYANRFGTSPGDMAKILDWLTSAGFHIEYTARGRDFIVFSGTAAQIEAALHASVHHYVVNGVSHFAISNDVSVPSAVAPLAGTFLGLDDFHPQRHPIHRPHPNDTGPTGEHALAPGDIAVIYDINPLFQQGYDGTGQTIVILGITDIYLSDIQAFRTIYLMPQQNIQTALTGTDPGFTDALGEADLDLEWSGAVAPNAQFYYVYASFWLDAANYAIDQNYGPVISTSVTSCEPDLSSGSATGMQFETEVEKANSMGVTFLAASGDEGPAACDSESENAATQGLAVYFPTSVPEVTGVGGTEFSENGGNYWSATSEPDSTSALSYIPEIAWNDTSKVGTLAASGGGVSTIFSKPTWQSGLGVPNDGMRDVPDMALAASGLHDAYEFFSGGEPGLVGGTSVATPIFAGMVALLKQYLAANGSPGVGNINPTLYSLAQSAPTVFHDIVVGDNMVPCVAGSMNCDNGVTEFGYVTGQGYDQVTGLGSVDAYNMVINWNAGPSKPTITSLSPTSATAAGSAFTLTVNGTNFASTATVNWNSTSLPTRFVAATELQASVSASLIAAAGTAVITVSSGGSLSGSIDFSIAPVRPPPLNYTDQRVTSQAPPATGCATPPPATTFATSSGTVYLYFAAMTAASDLLSNDWLAPDGSVVPGGSWPVQSGSFCFTGASLSITGLSGAKLGSWVARLYDNGTVVFTVPFTVTAVASSAPVISSLQNSASYASGSVSPGEIVALFGSGLGPSQITFFTLTNGLVPTTTGGTTVMFNTIAAPVIYSLAGQVAAIVPYEVSGSSAQVTVTYQGQTSAPFPVNVAAAVPGLFTSNASGTGQLAALNQDYTVNSLTQPAAADSVIQLFGTGEGQTSPGGVDGKITTSPYPHPVQDVSVTIGGQTATVDYAGSAPGEVAGVLQIDATIPSGVFGAAVPVTVKIGSSQSQVAGTISISPPASQSGFTVTSQETAATVTTNSDGSLNCTTPAAQTSFATTAAGVYIYLTFNGSQPGDVITFNWVHPSGQLDPSQPNVNLNFSGAGCAAAGLAIQGAEAATEPGTWQAKVYLNGALQFVLTFSIVQTTAAGFAVTPGSAVTAASVATNSSGRLSCIEPLPQTSFGSTTNTVWVWFAATGASPGDLFAVNWTQPNGQMYSYRPSSTLALNGSGCYAWGLNINGDQPASEPGAWKVSVSRNGTQLFSLPFAITN